MRYTSKFLIVGLLCIISTAVDFNLAAAQTETPPPTSTPGNPTSTSIFIPTSTPWSIFQWPTQSAFNDLCTPTPQATPTNPFPIDFTDYCLVQCEYCEGDGHEHGVCMDNCMEGISALTPTPIPTLYASPTPESINQIDAVWSNGSTILVDNNNYIKIRISYSISNAIYTGLMGGANFPAAYFTFLQDRDWPWVKEFYYSVYPTSMYTGTVNANQGSTVTYLNKVSFNNTYINYEEIGNYSCSTVGCPINWSHQKTGSATLDMYNAKSGWISYDHTDSAGDTESWDFIVEVATYPLYITENTPTPSPTPTLNPYCSAGIPTPGLTGSYAEPIVWMNPVTITPGDCYQIIPNMSKNLPAYEGFPETIGIPGFGICLNYLEINSSVFGISYDWLVTAMAFLSALGVVYKEIAS